MGLIYQKQESRRGQKAILKACGKTLLTRRCVVIVFFGVLGHFVWEHLLFRTLVLPVNMKVVVSLSKKFE